MKLKMCFRQRASLSFLLCIILASMLVFFPLFLHRVGCKLLLDVNWSVHNPHYRIRLLLYVTPFTKPLPSRLQRPCGNNHSCTQSMMVNLQSNHTADQATIWSTCSQSTLSVRHSPVHHTERKKLKVCCSFFYWQVKLMICNYTKTV